MKGEVKRTVVKDVLFMRQKHGRCHAEYASGAALITGERRRTKMDCNKCVWARRDGGCTSWDCEFIDKDEAVKAWMEKKGKGGNKDVNIN